MVPLQIRTPPAAAPGAFSVRGDPFPGRRAGESWLCGPATLFPRSPADPAGGALASDLASGRCGCGLTIGAMSGKVK